jgi:serine/threonine protein kinase
VNDSLDIYEESFKSFDLDDFFVLEGEWGYPPGFRVVTPKEPLAGNNNLGTRYLIKAVPKAISVEYRANAARVFRQVLQNRHLAQHLKSRVAFPLADVLDQTSGDYFLLMKEFSEGCQSVCQIRRTSRLIQNKFTIFINSRSQRQIFGTPELGQVRTVQLLGDFLATLASLHSLSIIIGDVSAENLLVQTKSKTRSSIRTIFIDADTFSLLGFPHPYGLQSTPHYFSPLDEEDPKHVATMADDIYKAGLILIRLLAQVSGSMEHSYDLYSIGPAKSTLLQMGGIELVALVDRCLSIDPIARPTAQELFETWAKYQSGFVTRKQSRGPKFAGKSAGSRR